MFMIFGYPRSLANLINPIKNEEEIQYIRVMLMKEDDAFSVKITDEAIISSIKEQIKKTKVRYVAHVQGITYDSDNYLLKVHVNSPDYGFSVQKDGSVYREHKKYVPVDDETIALFEMLDEAANEWFEKIGAEGEEK